MLTWVALRAASKTRRHPQVFMSLLLNHSAKSEWCREESSETVLNKMGERAMTNSVRLNLDMSFWQRPAKTLLTPGTQVYDKQAAV